MLAWSLSALCFLSATWILGADLVRLAESAGIGRERARLSEVAGALQEIEELLSAGMVPEPSAWEALKNLPKPWGFLAHESLQELRRSGGSLLPTLKRLRGLAEEHRASLLDARAKSSQALAQSLVCAVLVPLFAFALYYLLPGVEERRALWLIASGLGVCASLVGAAWLLAMSASARWGGLPAEQRPWVLASQCAGERFLALVRSGMPADLAWNRACELLGTEAPALALAWGHSLWADEKSEAAGARERNGSVLALKEAGIALRRAVQVSLMEGRPCTERAEAALGALRAGIGAQIARELTLLSTRALKPLFICVAPALLGLLAFGLFLGWDQLAGGAGSGF